MPNLHLHLPPQTLPSTCRANIATSHSYMEEVWDKLAPTFNVLQELANPNLFASSLVLEALDTKSQDDSKDELCGRRERKAHGKKNRATVIKDRQRKLQGLLCSLRLDKATMTAVPKTHTSGMQTETLTLTVRDTSLE